MTNNLKILIIDSDSDSLGNIKTNLQNIVNNIDATQSASCAIELAKKNHYAFIIIDDLFKHTQAISLIKKMKSIKKHKKTPIILISNQEFTSSFIDKVYSAGAIELLHKTISNEQLQIKANAFLNLAKLNEKYKNQIQEALIIERELIDKESILKLNIKNTNEKQILLEEQIELVHTNALIAETNTQSKNKLLESISNQLGKPLNEVLKSIKFLLKTHINDEQKDILESIELSSHLLNTILSDIFDISKIESGEINIKYKPFDLIKTLNDIKKLMSNKLQPKVEFILKSDKQIPTLLMGDFARIRQILTNLISNSAKFTQNGNITLSATIKDCDDFSISILFEVIDTGIGIDKQMQGKVFEKFTQETDSTARHYGGTGLGLPICKQLVKLMQGELLLKSDKDKGSNFYFELSFDKVDV